MEVKERSYAKRKRVLTNGVCFVCACHEYGSCTGQGRKQV